MAEAVTNTEERAESYDPECNLDRLIPSPFNPRKHLGDLTELESSIRAVGILEPLVARPASADPELDELELVFGHRRLAAAKAAGLPDVPVIVREYSDDEALEVQIVENMQREDVHPLDEADAFKILADRGHRISAIADKVGRSIPFVTQRIRLTTLTVKVRKSFDKGQLSLGALQELVKIADPKTMDRALKAILDQFHWKMQQEEGYQIAARQVRDLISDNFLLSLKEAPWQLVDEALVKAAGACTDCPKNTMAQGALFGAEDLKKGGDLCLDAICYRKKLDAVWRELKKAYPNRRFIEKKQEAEEALMWSSKLLSIDTERYVGMKRLKVSTLLRRAKVSIEDHVVMVKHPDSHRHLEMVPRSVVEKAESELEPKSRSEASDSLKQARAKEREERRQQGMVVDRAINLALELFPTANHSSFQDDVLKLVIRRAMNDQQTAICKRRGLEIIKTKHSWGETRDPEGTLLKAVEGYDATQRNQLLLELILQQNAPSNHYLGGAQWSEILEALGVDQKLIEKQVADERKEATKPKAKKKAPKKKRAAKA